MMVDGAVQNGTADGVAATATEADAGGADGEAAAAPVEPIVNPELEAFQRQFAAVQENTGDFNGWCSVISAAEKLGDIAQLRAVYDGFLAEYPLCYGYWKKYADAEQRHSSPEAAAAVFERGVAAVAHSVDLWNHYAACRAAAGASQEEVRGIFERGLAACGGDYLAHALWDKALQFELAAGQPLRAAAAYTRVLALPLRDLDRYWNSLRDFVAQRPAGDVMTPEERAALEEPTAAAKKGAMAAARIAAAAAAKAAAEEAARRRVEEAAAAEAAARAAEEERLIAAAAAAAEAALGAVPPLAPDSGPAPVSDAGAVVMVGAPDGVSAAGAPAGGPADEVAAGASGVGANAVEGMAVDGGTAAGAAEGGNFDAAVTDDDLKAAWLADREKTYKATKEELARRRQFEDAIKRPYFHVKPLDAAQLAAWGRYLDYAEPRLGDAGVAALFERCLVSCACYIELWARYARWLEPRDAAAADEAVRRAAEVHCKRRPEAVLLAARHSERRGKATAARTAYERVLKSPGGIAVGSLAATVASANFERRQGSKAAACGVYDRGLKAAAARGSAGAAAYAHLAIQYAHFLRVAYGDARGARAVYGEALRVHPAQLVLWEGAIHLEETLGGPAAERVAKVLALYERGVALPAVGAEARALPAAERETLSARAAAFADLASDAAALEAAEAAHAARFKFGGGILPRISGLPWISWLYRVPGSVPRIFRIWVLKRTGQASHSRSEDD
ncbi:hypothetical protein WJX81_004975 [Elliptochloris bilobata]|uniref:Suppressor of forked domain-containing protein n=1 Tax=Elliptochloris bilobata TaxID=381761 RepID=A0AAW1S467_9CHLO